MNTGEPRSRDRAFRTGPAPRIEPARVRLGFVPLTDCAPLVIARERGFFRDEGVDVTLSREPSWANVRDKLAVGALDGAQLLAPMSLSTSLGIDGVDVPLIVPLCLDLNGNAITVSTALAARIAAQLAEHGPDCGTDALAIGKGLRAVIEADRQGARPPLVFAVVFPFSSHSYTLRYWLAAAGIDPDRDVRILVAPPSAMVAMLEQQSIDGYCVGEPWNTLARVRGTGRTLVTSGDIWSCGPEKVLALRRDWAHENAATARAVTRALLRACQWLDDLTNRQEAVHVISGLSFVDAPVDVVAESMHGRIEDLLGRPRPPSDLHVFFRHAATFPWRSQAAWFVAQMVRWGQLEKADGLAEVIDAVYRPDLYREVAADLGIATPTIDWKTEGAHVTPWVLEQATAPIAMAPDRFLDGKPFDPNDLPRYLESLEISSLRIRLDELPESLVSSR
jgi:ABC-type nitrate/sulfonate/bicarbonate transport system substrate-binding protein